MAKRSTRPTEENVRVRQYAPFAGRLQDRNLVVKGRISMRGKITAAIIVIIAILVSVPR